ncbi:MAG: hypothetical protein R3Y23_03595 [Bacillota bacterium]
MASKKIATLCVNSESVTLIVQDNKYDNSFVYKSSVAYEGFVDGVFVSKESLFSAVRSLVEECRALAFCDPKSILVGVPGAFTTAVTKFVSTDLDTVRKVTDTDIDALYDIGNTYADSAEYITITAAPIYFTADKHNNTINPYIITSDKLTCLMSYVLCERKFIEIFKELSPIIDVEFEFHSTTMAQANYIVKPDLRDEGVILVDVGYTSSTVSYVKGDGIVHQMSFDLGGGTIAADLYLKQNIYFPHARALVNKVNLNLSPTEADEYFVDAGGKVINYKISEINEFVGNRVQNIADNIKRAIELSGDKVDKNSMILLTGSGISNMAGAKDIIEKTCQRYVDVIGADLAILNKPKDSGIAGLVLFQQKNTTSSIFATYLSKIKGAISRLRRNNNAK